MLLLFLSGALRLDEKPMARPVHAARGILTAGGPIPVELKREKGAQSTPCKCKCN